MSNLKTITPEMWEQLYNDAPNDELRNEIKQLKDSGKNYYWNGTTLFKEKHTIN